MSEEAIEERIRTLFQRLEKLEEKIFGNGQPGMLADLVAVKSDLAMIKRMLLAVFTVCAGILVKMFLK